MSVKRKITEKVASSSLWQKLVAQSHKENLPGFRKISLFNAIRKFREHVIWDDLIERASAISFNSAMALPPMILFLCTLIPVIAKFIFIVKLDLEGQLYTLIKTLSPQEIIMSLC